MKEATLVRRNLLRHPLRTFLMLACIAVAFLIFGVLGSVMSAFQMKDQVATAERLIVTNRNGFLQTLPLSHGAEIAREKGVEAASPVRMMLGYWRNPKDVMSAVMVEPASYLALSSAAVTVDDEDRRRFEKTRDGLLVGRQLAERNGWKRGDRVTLQSFNDLREDGTRAWAFTVAGIYTAAEPGGPETAVAGHYAYFNEALLTGRDRVNWFILATAGGSANDRVSRAVDRTFANSASATKTQSEAALGRAFLAQIGDLVTIVRLIVGAAFVVILFVVGNTMMFTVVERTREIGVLRTLGFSRARIARLVGGEVALLVVLGGMVGLAAAALIVSAIGSAVKDVLPGIRMGSGLVATGIGLMALLALLTGLLPVINACRLSIVGALGRRS